jgi:hypothetical protein
MPRKPKYQLIRCSHFSWRIWRRNGVWYADGRSNPIDAGRHSLGTRERSEALRLLVRLVEAAAVRHDLIIERRVSTPTASKELTLAEGRRVYEDFIGRSRITGGVKESTKKRYRAVFDKFLPWANSHGVVFFH